MSGTITLCALGMAAALASGCGRASPPAPVPPQPATVPPASANAGFMQGMIVHHAQALVMTRLVAARTGARDIRALAERIAASQREEIALMERWLVQRGYPVPDTTHLVMGHHPAGDSLMPGMLSSGQLDALERARGADFDRTFLSLMIQHHRGALAMVQQLQRSGARDAEAWNFAAEVDADQRAEIARMERMLAARGSPPPSP